MSHQEGKDSTASSLAVGLEGAKKMAEAEKSAQEGVKKAGGASTLAGAAAAGGLAGAAVVGSVIGAPVIGLAMGAGAATYYATKSSAAGDAARGASLRKELILAP